MLKLDNNLLNELGLGTLPEEQKRSMLQHIYDTLELRVGTRLANQMTDQQLQEFEKFIDAGGDNNQAQALQWLETNLPNYKQVVNDVFEELKTEVKQMAPQILASTTASAGESQGVADQVQQPQSQQPQQPTANDQASYAQQPPVDQTQPYAQPNQFNQQPQPTAPPQPTPAPQQPSSPSQPGQPLQAPQFGAPSPAQPVQPQQPYGPTPQASPSQPFDPTQPQQQ